MKVTAARYWKDALTKNLITKEDVDLLKKVDPSPTKKYLDWLVKIWITEKPSIDEVRNYIEEFHALVESHRIVGVDINRLPSYDFFKNLVNEENEKASSTLEELENDYEVIRNDEDVLIVVPHTHEASRRLGLTYFGTREDKTCSWCTTYATNSHFNNYYYTQGVTFYYIKVKSPLLQKQLKDTNLFHVAFAIYPTGKITAYNAEDNSLSSDKLSFFRKIVGI